jgi:adenylate cyclase
VIFRPLGRIVVMGRTLPVPIFEPVALKEDVTSQTRECLGLFEEALAKYYARDWAAAIAGFERSAALEPNQPGKTPGVKSNPSLVYVNMAQAYRHEPPPEDWAGVYVMKEK